MPLGVRRRAGWGGIELMDGRLIKGPGGIGGGGMRGIGGIVLCVEVRG